MAGNRKEQGSAGIIRCGSCGKEIGNRKRCPYCGVEPGGPSEDELMDAQALARVHRQEAQGRSARVVMVLAVIMFVVLGAAAAMYFLSANIPQSPERVSPPASAVAEGSTAPTAVDPQAGSSDIAPDQVNPANLDQPLTGGTVPPENAGDSGQSASDSEITEKKATELVMARPEVKAWMKLIQKNSPQNHARFQVEGPKLGRYIVHAYEDVDDGNGQGHTATFGWYEVDKGTGEVLKTEE